MPKFDYEELRPVRVRDPWRTWRALTSEEQERFREGLRFIKGFYYTLLALSALPPAAIAWLSWFS